MRLMRNASSPSLISISAMPDSSSSSISFLIFRMSMLGNAPLGDMSRMGCRVAVGSGRLGELLHRGSHCQLITERTQAGDDADRYVRKVRVVTKCLARLRVRKVYLHELQAYPEQSVAQRNARMRERAWVEYQKADA